MKFALRISIGGMEMIENIKWKENTLPKVNKDDLLDFLSIEEVSKAKNFHSSFPQYSETPDRKSVV